MGKPTIDLEAVVLKKTKLGETDLILTLLSSDGSLVRAVAKGARKPSNTFAGRLELGAVNRLLLAEGKSLHIISEVREIDPHVGLRDDIARSSAASCGLELASLLCQEDAPEAKIFDLTCAFLDVTEQADPKTLAALVAAYTLKAMSFVGFRPSFTTCVLCGAPIAADPDLVCGLSCEEGGALCPACRSAVPGVPVSAPVLHQANGLLFGTFAQIAQGCCDAAGAATMLQLSRSFAQVHCGSRLKAVDFFETCTLPLIYS